MLLTPNVIQLYTDGAVKNNGGPGTIGMGVVLRLLGTDDQAVVTREYSWAEERERATNIQAELEAIVGGLERIVFLFRPHTRLTLYTDSQWCERAILGQQRVNVYLDRVIVARQLLAQFLSHQIVHVRGHTGIEFNERADLLATAAAGSTGRGPKKR